MAGMASNFHLINGATHNFGQMYAINYLEIFFLLVPIVNIEIICKS